MKLVSIAACALTLIAYVSGASLETKKSHVKAGLNASDDFKSNFCHEGKLKLHQDVSTILQDRKIANEAIEKLGHTYLINCKGAELDNKTGKISGIIYRIESDKVTKILNNLTVETKAHERRDGNVLEATGLLTKAFKPLSP